MTKDRAAIEREYDVVMRKAWGVIKTQNEQHIASSTSRMSKLKRGWIWTRRSPAERFLENLPRVLSDIDFKLNRAHVCDGGFDPGEPLHVYGVRLANAISPIDRDCEKACKAADLDVVPILNTVRTTSIALVAIMYEERMGFSCCDVPDEVKAYMEQSEPVATQVLGAPKAVAA